MRFAVSDLRHLDFCPPDLKKFPCLRLAYEAAEAGGAKTVALNAADEVAVAAFLEGRIGFNDIPRIIEDVLAVTNAEESGVYKGSAECGRGSPQFGATAGGGRQENRKAPGNIFRVISESKQLENTYFDYV